MLGRVCKFNKFRWKPLNQFNNFFVTQSAQSQSLSSRKLDDGLTLSDFLPNQSQNTSVPDPDPLPNPLPNPIVGVPSLLAAEGEYDLAGKLYYLETYGCQMNVSDSEIVRSILNQAGLKPTTNLEVADVILVNTCAIRDNAEQKIWQRLDVFRKFKRRKRVGKPPRMIGVLGCMAERLKTKLLESDKLVDVVVGPDAYRDLPRLLNIVDETGDALSNTLLSLDETYADVTPVRDTDQDGVSAFITIMRGCDNMCAFCVVPQTRGRERSRDVYSIVDEAQRLRDQGFREITLLGQNVNSYNYREDGSRVLSSTKAALTRGFNNISRRPIADIHFTELLQRVSEAVPEVRIRFTSPHPKDFPDDLLYLLREKDNICKQLHIPAQSGSTKVLERMRRGYTREAYLSLVELMRKVLGNHLSLSTDMITGFPQETEEEHAETLSLLRSIQYDQAFMFKYSQREKTYAHRHFSDDIPEHIKTKRLGEMIEHFRVGLWARNQECIGTTQLVLLDGFSTRVDGLLTGRTDGNKRVRIPPVEILSDFRNPKASKVIPKPGDFVAVHITASEHGSLAGPALGLTSIRDFAKHKSEIAAT